MKMVLATPLYPPQSGGPATYARILEEELPKHGIEVTVVKFGDVLSLPPLIRHIVYFCLLLVHGFRAQILFVQDTVSAGLPAALASRVLGIPLVLRVPGDFAWEQGVQRYQVTDGLDEFQKKTYGARVERLRSIQKFVARSAHTIIVPSKYMEDIVGTWVTAKEKIVVIHNSVTPQTGGAVPPAVLQAPRPLFVTVGRLVPWKQVDKVIDAVAALHTGTLVVVGDGPQRAYLEHHARSKNVQVTFLGSLAKEDVAAVIECADVCVLYSTYEGFSHVLMEAVLTGTRVVASDIPANRELLSGTSHKLARIDVAEDLERALLESAALPKVQNLQKLKDEFSPERMALRVSECVKQII